MSMLKTLAKVAIGVMIAKGVTGMMNKDGDTPQPRQTDDARGGRSRGPSIDDILTRRSEPEFKPGSGSVFGGKHSPRKTTGTEGRGSTLEDILGGILGGGPKSEPKRGGLGGALDELSDLSRPGKGGADPVPRNADGGSFGDLLNDSFDGYGGTVEPTAAQEDLARVMLRAMLQAAKSDGRIDSSEKKRLLDQMGQATREEMEFIQSELAKPIDIQGLVGDTPRGSESEIYLMSLMGIDLDSKAEAQYLHTLASALGIDQSTCNEIHDKLGVPRLYR